MNTSVVTAPEDRPREARFTIDQYYLIADSGALDEFGRTELLDGRIVVMNAQHVPHASVKMAIYDALRDRLRETPSALNILVEAAVEIGDSHIVEPDIFLWMRTAGVRSAYYGDVALIVEIADSSETGDLGYKRRIYAEHGIPEYWVAVLRTRRIERFAEPVDGAYAQHDSFDFADAVESVTLPGIGIPAGTPPAA